MQSVHYLLMALFLKVQMKLYTMIRRDTGVDHELAMIETAKRETSVLIPAVYKCDDRTYFMEYIEGITLREYKESRTAEDFAEVLARTRSSVKEMKKITRSYYSTGRNFFHHEYLSGSSVHEYITKSLEIIGVDKCIIESIPEFTCNVFVLSHNDLCYDNIIIDSDNNPWIIDWETSGFYYPEFERTFTVGEDDYIQIDYEDNMTYDQDIIKITELLYFSVNDPKMFSKTVSELFPSLRPRCHKCKKTIIDGKCGCP